MMQKLKSRWSSRKKNDKIIIIVSTIICSLSIFLIVFGSVVKALQSSQMNQYEKKYANTTVEKAKAEIDRAEKYNETIRSLKDGTARVNETNNTSAYESIFSANNGMIGVLNVPKSDIRLPIYHNADDETIAKGVGHVNDTSFPIDTHGTKSVLTSHNGLPGADMLFTRLDETQVGDEFYIQIADENYHYKVKHITVMTPEETEIYAQRPINVDENANVCLVTCTPYGLNTHRLLVIGEFSDKSKVSQIDGRKKSHFSLGKETIALSVMIFGSTSLAAYTMMKNYKV